MVEQTKMATVSVGMDKEGWLCLQTPRGECLFISSIDKEEREEVRNFLSGLLK